MKNGGPVENPRTRNYLFPFIIAITVGNENAWEEWNGTGNGITE